MNTQLPTLGAQPLKSSEVPFSLSKTTPSASKSFFDVWEIPVELPMRTGRFAMYWQLFSDWPSRN